MPRKAAGRPTAGAWALGAYGLLVAAVTAGNLVRYPIPELLAKFAACLSAAWLAWALRSLGRLALHGAAGKVAIPDLGGRWTAALVHSTLGAGLLTFAIILLGWAVPGDLHLKLRILLGLLVAVSVAGFMVPPTSEEPRAGAGLRFAPVAWAILPAAGCAAAFLSSFSPITHYDSLVYHLALPAIYLRDGAITAVSHNLYSFFPAAAEMLFLFILGLLPAPEYVINLLGWGLAVLLGGAVAENATALSGKRAGWIALGLWWTAPLVLLLCGGAYVDLPLAAATFAAIVCFQRGLDNRGPGLFALAGALAGFAFSIKYTGAMTFLILAGILAARCARGKSAPRDLLIFSAAAAVFPAPWLLKNFFACGNPVFPFLYKWLGGNVGWTAASAKGYFQVLTEYGARSNVLVDLFSLPGAAASMARGGFDVLGDFGWPFVLLSAPLAFLFKRGNRAVAFLSIYAALHFAGWFVSKPVLRFLVAAFPVFVLLAAVAIAALLKNPQAPVRWATGLIAAGWIASNIFMYGLAASELKLFAVPIGDVSADGFLRQRLAFFPTFDSLNQGLRGDDAVLLVGEQRTFHLKVPFLASNIASPSAVSELANKGASPADFSAALSAKNVRFVVVNESEIKRLGGLSPFGFDDKGAEAFRSFLAERTTVVSEDRGVVLRRIEPSRPVE